MYLRLLRSFFFRAYANTENFYNNHTFFCRVGKGIFTCQTQLLEAKFALTSSVSCPMLPFKRFQKPDKGENYAKNKNDSNVRH